MCDLCRADENYFHTAECVYDQLVSEYPVMWLRDSTRIGACYTLRELLSPEGMVLAIQNSLPMKGWRLRMRYNEAIDEEINPQHGDCIELPSRADALQAFVGSGSLPQLLKTDNGSEFAGKMLDKCKRLVRTVLIFTESSDQLSRATDRVPGLPASPGYVQ